MIITVKKVQRKKSLVGGWMGRSQSRFKDCLQQSSLQQSKIFYEFRENVKQSPFTQRDKFHKPQTFFTVNK